MPTSLVSHALSLALRSKYSYKWVTVTLNLEVGTPGKV